MKRNGRKIRLNYRLICFENNGDIVRYQKRKKTQISSVIKHSSAQKWILKVGYIPNVCNEGIFTEKTELLYALKIWTEKALLDYVEEGNW